MHWDRVETDQRSALRMLRRAGPGEPAISAPCHLPNTGNVTLLQAGRWRGCGGGGTVGTKSNQNENIILFYDSTVIFRSQRIRLGLRFWISVKFWHFVLSLTHSLTAAPDQRGGHSDLHNERSCADDIASRLCSRDPLPPVVSRSSLSGQVDASSRGQGICPARGWHSAGGCCGLAHLVVGGKHVLAMSVFCQLWWEVDPSHHREGSTIDLW